MFKKSLSLGLIIVSMSATAFAQSTSVKLTVGETRIINDTVVSCNGTSNDRVCQIVKVDVGPMYKKVINYVVRASYDVSESYMNGNGVGVTTKTKDVGTFATPAEAQTRMNQLISKGYCN